MFGTPGRLAILRLGASSNMGVNAWAVVRTATRTIANMPSSTQSRSSMIPKQFFNNSSSTTSLSILNRPSHFAFAAAARGYATATKNQQAAAKEQKAAAKKQKEEARKAKAALAQEKKKAQEQARKAKEAVKKEKAKALEAAKKEKAKALEAAKKEKAKAQEAARKEKAKAREALKKEKAKLAAEKQKAKKTKLQPWELVDESGKKIPMPTERRPRRTTAINIFIKRIMAEQKAQGQPAPKLGEVAERFKALPESDRQALRDEAQRLHAQFERDLKAWEASLTSQDHARIAAYNRYQLAQARKEGRKAPKISRVRDPSKPVRPLSAFFRFWAEKRQQSPAPITQSNISQFTQDVAKEYRNLTPEQKAPYEAGAKQEMDQWRIESAQYKNEMSLPG